MSNSKSEVGEGGGGGKFLLGVRPKLSNLWSISDPISILCFSPEQNKKPVSDLLKNKKYKNTSLKTQYPMLGHSERHNYSISDHNGILPT